MRSERKLQVNGKYLECLQEAAGRINTKYDQYNFLTLIDNNNKNGEETDIEIDKKDNYNNERPNILNKGLIHDAGYYKDKNNFNITDLNISNNLDTIEETQFDRIYEYSTYFPNNNFSIVIMKINEKKSAILDLFNIKEDNEFKYQIKTNNKKKPSNSIISNNVQLRSLESKITSVRKEFSLGDNIISKYDIDYMKQISSPILSNTEESKALLNKSLNIVNQSIQDEKNKVTKGYDYGVNTEINVDYNRIEDRKDIDILLRENELEAIKSVESYMPLIDKIVHEYGENFIFNLIKQKEDNIKNSFKI